MDWNSGEFLCLLPGSSTVLHLLQKFTWHLCVLTSITAVSHFCLFYIRNVKILKHWWLGNKSPWSMTKPNTKPTKLSSWPDWSSAVLALLLWQLFLHSREISMELHEGMFNAEACKTALQMEGKEMPLLQARRTKWDKTTSLCSGQHDWRMHSQESLPKVTYHYTLFE